MLLPQDRQHPAGHPDCTCTLNVSIESKRSRRNSPWSRIQAIHPPLQPSTPMYSPSFIILVFHKSSPCWWPFAGLPNCVSNALILFPAPKIASLTVGFSKDPDAFACTALIAFFRRKQFPSAFVELAAVLYLLPEPVIIVWSSDPQVRRRYLLWDSDFPCANKYRLRLYTHRDSWTDKSS